MNYKIRVSNEAESKEIQELFRQLGYNKAKDCKWLIDSAIEFFATENKNLHCWDSEKYGEQRFNGLSNKEITLQQLKDLVILKRNDIQDATHTSYSKFYYLTDNEFYEYIGDKWVNVDEFVDGLEFKAVSRDDVIEHLTQLQCVQDNLTKKEYLVPLPNGDYELVKSNSKINKSWIEVPDGATIYAVNGDVKTFYKDDGNTQFDDVEWKPCDGVGLVVYNNLKTFLRFGEGGKVVWERQNDAEEPMTEDNQITVNTQAIVDVNPIFGHSDLFDKIRKGEISFDFSEMKTGRDEDVVENPQPSKPSDLFKDDYTNLNKIKVEWFEKFLHGVKVQCRVIGTKGWQNMTWKSLDKMKLNIEFREKPTTVEVDGMKFDTVDKLTSYLKSMTNLK